MQYIGIIRNIALQAIDKPVQVPDYHLMVGTAEDLKSQPIVTYADFMPENVYKRLPNPEMTYEEVQEKLSAGELTIDDFFQNTYPLGNPLEKG